MNDSLQRFIEAQEYGYENALREMMAGKKRNHWIWYIFPQIKGLGHSLNARYYGIESIEEAKAYLEHPILAARLRGITQAVIEHSSKDINEIMGSTIDAMKFRSSMTLFDAVSPDDVFAQALDIFFDGSRDNLTLALIR